MLTGKQKIRFGRVVCKLFSYKSFVFRESLNAEHAKGNDPLKGGINGYTRCLFLKESRNIVNVSVTNFSGLDTNRLIADKMTACIFTLNEIK